MFTRYLIPDAQRGLLSRDGRLVRWLEPGATRVFTLRGRWELTLLSRETLWSPFSPELKAVAPAGAGVEAFVPEGSVGLLRADGLAKGILQPGRYLLWQLVAPVTLETVSLLELRPAVPEAFWAFLPGTQLQTVLVLPFERALVYVDGALRELLGEGRFAYSVLNRKLEVSRVDLREQEVQILGRVSDLSWDCAGTPAKRTQATDRRWCGTPLREVNAGASRLPPQPGGFMPLGPDPASARLNDATTSLCAALLG